MSQFAFAIVARDDTVRKIDHSAMVRISRIPSSPLHGLFQPQIPGPTDGYLCPTGENRQAAVLCIGLDLRDPLQIDEKRAMHTHKLAWIETFLEARDRLLFQ